MLGWRGSRRSTWLLSGLAITSLGRGALAAEHHLELALDVPAHLDAWQRVTLKIRVANRSADPVQLVQLTVRSAEGDLKQWGLEGHELLWGSWARARKTARGYDILSSRALPSQRVAPPTALEREATERLVRLAPLPGGTQTVLETSFDASYQHGGRFTAVLSYFALSSKASARCFVAPSPSVEGFVPCSRKPASAADQAYLPAREIARGLSTMEKTASFVVRHPAFDVDAARARARIAAGPFAYDIVGRRWVLVDEKRDQTVLVAERGPIEQLPGSWLEPLVHLNASGETSLSWIAATPGQARAIREALASAGIAAQPFSFKGRAEPLRLVVTLSRATLGHVAALATRHRARLDGHTIR